LEGWSSTIELLPPEKPSTKPNVLKALLLSIARHRKRLVEGAGFEPAYA
jgi:hypothetical protein